MRVECPHPQLHQRWTVLQEWLLLLKQIFSMKEPISLQEGTTRPLPPERRDDDKTGSKRKSRATGDTTTRKTKKSKPSTLRGTVKAKRSKTSTALSRRDRPHFQS